MRLPFALDLKVGTDICDARRIYQIINGPEHRRDSLISKLLIRSEIAYIGDRYLSSSKLYVHPTDHELRLLARRLAGRFAAKEAAKKAWGASVISWHDLYTEYHPDQSTIVCRSRINLRDPTKAYEPVTEQVGQLSISHDGDYAVATVIAAPLHSDILIELQRRKAEADEIFTTINSTATNSPIRKFWAGLTDGPAKTTTSAKGD